MAESRPVHVLYMEDDPGVGRLVQKGLEQEGYVVDLAHDGEEGLSMYAVGSYDVVVVDQNMPVRDGLEVIRLLASHGPLPPAIMVTGTGSEQIAVEAMKLGARDYIVKDVDGGFLELLPAVIEQVLQQQRLFEGKRRAEEALQKAHDQEEALRKSEERFRSLFEDAPLCIFEVDLTRKPPTITRANRRAEQVYGWLSQEFESIPLDSIVPPEAIPEVAQIVDALRAGGAITVESVNQRRDGSVFPVRISAASVTAFDPSRIILNVEDITAEEQRHSEEEAIAEERRRIAQEIHDGLAQNLAALRFKARQWHKLVDTDPAQMHAELDELREILSDSIVEVRRSIFALRPIDLEEQGFFPALRHLALGFGENYGLRVNLDISEPQERLPPSLELTLFRVIQEALNNVGKHAQAGAVWVTLDLEATDAVTLTIRDDGKGFDPSSLAQAVRDGHLGLKQMRERVEKINGTLSIQGQPDQGTEVRAVLPLTGRK